MMITNAGTLVRTRVSEVSIVGRNTQGVTLIRTTEDELVVGLQRDEDEDDALDDDEVDEMISDNISDVPESEPTDDADSEEE
ncbi:DNA gyrase C-terminal beta-propeller domain-containing protein, partial [Enterobacter cloacae]